MKLFLIGPKFNVAKSNFSEFEKVSKHWRELENIVISSAELDIGEGADREHGWVVPIDNQYISDLFRRDVGELVKCDGVVLMTGWRDDSDCQLLYDISYHSDMVAFEQTGENQFEEMGYDDDDEYEFYPVEEKPTVKLDKRFSAIVKELEDLHDKKQMDYGRQYDPFSNVRASEDFGIPGWVGAIVRGNDKMKRLQKFARGEDLVNETVKDSFMDLAVYSIIAMILFEESNGQKKG